MKPIQDIQRFKSEYALIEHLAEISNLMLPDRKKRLKPIEQKCFCVLVMAHNKFGDITSKSARDWILVELSKKKGRFTPNSLSRYRTKLWRKGWLLKDSDDNYRVAPVYDFSLVPLATNRVFVFGIVYEGQSE